MAGAEGRVRRYRADLIGPLQSTRRPMRSPCSTSSRRWTDEKIAAPGRRDGAPEPSSSPLCAGQTGREPQKAGIDPAEAVDFVAFCRNELRNCRSVA